MVYDLVAVGRDPGSDEEPVPVVLDLAEDLIFFRLAQARAGDREGAAGAAGNALGGGARRGAGGAAGGLDRPLEYPDAMGNWRTWL